MVVSLVIHGVVFMLVRRSIAKPEIPLEYTVGAFNIVAGSNSEPHALAGKFELHVRFIDDLQAPPKREFQTTDSGFAKQSRICCANRAAPNLMIPRLPA